MKPWLITLTWLCCGLALTSCGNGSATDKTSVHPPQVGGLYSFNDGEGGFRVGKIIAVENDAIFLSLYGDRWTKRPSLAAARQAATPVMLAYTPATFAGMQPVRLENGTATAEETEAYETWKQGKREVF